MTTTPEPLLLSSTTASGRVRVLTLNRPSALNAISSALARALFDALDAAGADASVRAVVVTGAGRAFSAGADVRELARLTPAAAAARDWLGDWNARVLAFRKPLLAAVNGLALGGGAELALMCDVVHAARGAAFALPEVALGTIPGAGGSQRLVRAVGKSRACEMVFTGDRMHADEALRRGLVSRVFEDAELVDGCVAFAERVAEKGADALRLAKDAVALSQRGVVDALAEEKRLYHMSFGTEDFREGVAAFLEKRKPSFR